MTSMSEPTTGEIVRRLDEISKRLEETVREIREDRAAMSTTYVRKDVYEARHRALGDDVRDINTRFDKADQWKRSVTSGAAIFAIGWLATLLLAVNNFIAGRG